MIRLETRVDGLKWPTSRVNVIRIIETSKKCDKPKEWVRRKHEHFCKKVDSKFLRAELIDISQVYVAWVRQTGKLAVILFLIQMQSISQEESSSAREIALIHPKNSLIAWFEMNRSTTDWRVLNWRRHH